MDENRKKDIKPMQLAGKYAAQILIDSWWIITQQVTGSAVAKSERHYEDIH